MTFQTQPKLFQDIEEEEVRYATARVDVPASGTEQFVIDSPAGVDKKAQIISLGFRVGSAFTIDYKTGFSIDTSGTDFFIANANTAGPDSSDLTFEYGGSYSGGTKIAESFVPGATANKGAGTSLEDIELIVENNTELMIEVTNQNTSSSAFMALVFVFAERNV